MTQKLRKKYKIVTDETDNKIHIILAPKTTYKNSFNNHKYLNNKRTCHIQVLHKRKNWKDISQAVLDNIELPPLAKFTDFRELNYKSFIFNFRTITDEVISIPLYHCKEDDITTILTQQYNPCFFRTNFPKDFISTHLSDFVTMVLYELYSNASVLNEMILDAALPKNYLLLNGIEHYFYISSLEHNKLELCVTDTNGEKVDVTGWSISPEGKIYVNSNGYQLVCNIAYSDYLEDEEGKLVYDTIQDRCNVNYYNFSDNKITMYFDDNTFKLEQKDKVVIVEILDTDDNIVLTNLVSYNLKRSNIIYKKSWELLVDPVKASLGDTVDLCATLTSMGVRNDWNGKVKFYLITDD